MPEYDAAFFEHENAALLKRVHAEALKAGIAHGLGLWDRFPPGITMQILRAGIAVEAIDFHPEFRHLIVMDISGDLYRCDSYASPPTLIQ